MHCIFCKSNTDNERSVEHIIPESFGNTEHVLPCGAVCFKCNQYFSRKIERQILESPIFLHLRNRMSIPSKKGRVPKWEPLMGLEKPTYRLMARFIGKIGLEALAFKTKDVDGWNDQLVALSDLDDLRQFVRYNQGEDWPFTFRFLHPPEKIFNSDEGFYELLHEFDILLTERMEAYAVISLNGVELVINVGGRVLDGYRLWLEKNEYRSPLYVGKNA